MKGVNQYWYQLSRSQIASGQHRVFVGDLWQEIGRLQIDFMREKGLAPHHKLLDIGCGSLRGGIHFVEFLENENYYGIDVNQSLLVAGQQELMSANLLSKRPNLLANG